MGFGESIPLIIFLFLYSAGLNTEVRRDSCDSDGQVGESNANNNVIIIYHNNIFMCVLLPLYFNFCSLSIAGQLIRFSSC